MAKKLVQGQTKKVCLESPLKKMNSVCTPGAFWQAVSKSRMIVAECSLLVVAGGWIDQKAGVVGPQGLNVKNSSERWSMTVKTLKN